MRTVRHLSPFTPTHRPVPIPSLDSAATGDSGLGLSRPRPASLQARWVRNEAGRLICQWHAVS